MNYRHHFHAGNRADVVKHALWVALVEAMQALHPALYVVETHACGGLYDLRGAQAQKTGEALEGIHTLWGSDLPPPFANYLQSVCAVNQGTGALRYYPGSPLLIQQRLRPHDSTTLAELHAPTAQQLRKSVGMNPRIHILADDGYAMLARLKPAPSAKLLVLIDPPFESKTEALAIQAALTPLTAHTIALWYPIKTMAEVREFQAALPGKPWCFMDVQWYPDVDASRLNGTGFAVLSPPAGFAKALEAPLKILMRQLLGGDYAKVNLAEAS